MALTIEQAKRIIEAALFYSSEPMTVKKLAEIFNEEDDVNANAVQDILALIKDDYQSRGIELIEVATGFRFQVCADLSDWITRLMTEKPARYSRALLETLALIAYKQPITRAEIEEVRGVSVSSNIIRTLEEREWIKVIGHRDVPGKPALFATTKRFLDDMNLTSLSQLPTLAEIQDLDDGQLSQQLQLALGEDHAAQSEQTEQSENDSEQITPVDNSEQAEQIDQTEQIDQPEQPTEDIQNELTIESMDDEPEHNHDEEDEHATIDAHDEADQIEQHIIETNEEEIKRDYDEDDELNDSLDMILEEIFGDG